MKSQNSFLWWWCSLEHKRSNTVIYQETTRQIFLMKYTLGAVFLCIVGQMRLLETRRFLTSQSIHCHCLIQAKNNKSLILIIIHWATGHVLDEPMRESACKLANAIQFYCNFTFFIKKDNKNALLPYQPFSDIWNVWIGLRLAYYTLAHV